ncbi:glycosyltransferase [Sphingobacterium sp.]|uniref:glycosyltransferase n=1 Tax=Sphingobacterium sp. TaxID=341027 RepID=UPI0028A94C9B|nr:glycosyltransferase [Sphingobacterium sp.]
MCLSNNKILFVTPSFSKGGAEKNMLNIINSLDDTFDITLCICTDNVLYLDQLNKKIKVIELKRSGVNRSMKDIYRLLKLINPNIVFSSALHVSLPLILFRKVLNLKFIKISRIPSLPSNKLENTLKSKLINNINKYYLNYSDWVIAQSDQMKDEIISFYNLNKEKVIVIKNIVDIKTISQKSLEPLDFHKEFFHFVAAGSLYSAKGFDLLIKAFKIHVKSYPNTRLIIIGDESIEFGYKKYLIDLINDLNLQNKVQLAGYQNNPYKYFYASDAFVLSSLKEGFPNVVLENLVLSKPVLVTNCVDFSGVINSRNGVIVEKGKVEALVEGLMEIRKIQFKSTELPQFNFNNWFLNLINEGTTSNK